MDMQIDAAHKQWLKQWRKKLNERMEALKASAVGQMSEQGEDLDLFNMSFLDQSLDVVPARDQAEVEVMLTSHRILPNQEA